LQPSRIALAKIEAKLVGEMDAHFRLKDKIEPIRRTYPHIVIDCPPALGLLTVNALVAATHLLIPIQVVVFRPSRAPTTCSRRSRRCGRGRIRRCGFWVW